MKTMLLTDTCDDSWSDAEQAEGWTLGALAQAGSS